MVSLFEIVLRSPRAAAQCARQTGGVSGTMKQFFLLNDREPLTIIKVVATGPIVDDDETTVQ
jgi:hypothetical protein